MDKALTEQDLQDDIALKVYEGDESALSDILRYYAPRIENYLINQYRGQLNNADVEDVVCIMVRKFWDYREQYDDKKGTIKSFLYFIANNVTKDILRTGWYKARQLERSTEREFFEQSLITENHLNQSPMDTENSEESDIIKATNKVLSNLSDIQRKILLADAMADGVAESAELGERLGGYPAATIRQYRMRAKKAFRDGMKKLGFNIPEAK